MYGNKLHLKFPKTHGRNTKYPENESFKFDKNIVLKFRILITLLKTLRKSELSAREYKTQEFRELEIFNSDIITILKLNYFWWKILPDRQAFISMQIVISIERFHLRISTF